METSKKYWPVRLDRSYKKPVDSFCTRFGSKYGAAVSLVLDIAIATDWKILQVDKESLTSWIDSQFQKN
ncbi:hypothetical protein [Leptothoe spongobia]|uniref:Uncharacterized protein n=1 Tax=Leptothoe spongobia TAU-MAC 1115 TaxID=1967444 RepID=A0A947DFS9_9CYAN|nr:hypothetical protein [Leptothoe spongobia]MBT9316262.1 hypothetical protein [Leptothoe spongobia TAU-MAC 1115]